MNKEQAREITHELREYGYDTAACDEGLERQTALDAADLIESLQRERDNPQPLDFNQLKVGNPVWITGLNRWELILGIDAEWMKIYLSNNNQLIYGSCDLYATEPKGDEAK